MAAVTPLTFTKAGSPDDANHRNSPDIVASVGLTSTTMVFHPPPSTNCGIVNAAAVGPEKSATGNVVSRASPRRFLERRKAIVDTGKVDRNVNVPRTSPETLKGSSFRNAAIWRLGPM